RLSNVPYGARDRRARDLATFAAPAAGGMLDSGTDAEISAQLLLFVEQTRDFVGVADGWGRVLYINPAAAKRLGIADPAGLTLADLFPSEESAFYHDVIRPELLRVGSWSGEVGVNVGAEGVVMMNVSTTATIGPGGAIDGLVLHARELPQAPVWGAHGARE